MHACMPTCTHTYTHIHTYIHTDMHTQRQTDWYKILWKYWLQVKHIWSMFYCDIRVRVPLCFFRAIFNKNPVTYFSMTSRSVVACLKQLIRGAMFWFAVFWRVMFWRAVFVCAVFWHVMIMSWHRVCWCMMSWRRVLQSGSLVHIYRDGSVLIAHGGTEMGQGLHTKMIQVRLLVLGGFISVCLCVSLSVRYNDLLLYTVRGALDKV